MTESQRHALDDFWQDYGIEYTQDQIDLIELFGRPAPTVMDIGTGMGDSCIALASNHPENNYLAVEVHRPGVGSLLRQIHTRQLGNVRVSNHDVIEILTYQTPPNSLDEVHIFFPDPWPKKRHFKRRLINPVFLRLLSPCLKSHARLFIATDWEDYAESILAAIAETPGYVNLAGDQQTAPRPHWRPLTKFEKRGKSLGHAVYDFVFSYKDKDNTSVKS